MTDFTLTLPTRNLIMRLPVPETHFYRFHCIPTGKSYIGRTNSPVRRITEHLMGEGSKGLIAALVEYGRIQFTIALIDSSNAPDPILNIIEDHYIHFFNALHPTGFNMRLNSPIIPTDEYIDLNSIHVSTKFVSCRSNHLYFTVGEFTHARFYQTLANVCNQIGGVRRCPVKKKRKYRFNFYERNCETNATQYNISEVYDLNLKYNMISNRLTLLP